MADSSYEQDTRTYVLKIWREDDDMPGKSGRWRGYITNVMSKETIHVQNIVDVSNYLKAQLRDLGVANEKRRTFIVRLCHKD